jgi:hypothetical protein
VSEAAAGMVLHSGLDAAIIAARARSRARWHAKHHDGGGRPGKSRKLRRPLRLVSNKVGNKRG